MRAVANDLRKHSYFCAVIVGVRQPAWVHAVVGFERGNPLLAEARIRALRTICRVAWELAGPIPEREIARKRIAARTSRPAI